MLHAHGLRSLLRLHASSSFRNHGQGTSFRIVNVADIVVDLQVKRRLVDLDLLHDVLLLRLLPRVVALAAAVVARARRDNAIFAGVWRTIATLTVLFIQDLSMCGSDRLRRVASVWSTATLALL